MSAPTDERISHVMRSVDPGWDHERSERALEGLHRRARRRRLQRNATFGAAALVLAAAAFVLVPWRVESSAPVAAAPAEPVTADSNQVTLSDGSTLRREGDAEVVVHEVSPTKVRVALTHGRVSVDVTPRPEREFVVDAGRFRTLVLGTSFDVDRSDQGVEVSVRHGHVRVERDDGALMGDLYAGQSRLFGESSEPLLLPTAEAAPSDTAAVATAAPAEQPVAQAPVKKVIDWRPHVRDSRYEEAYQLLREAGSGAVRDSVDDLLLAADAARLSGHQAQALPYLDRVVSKYSGDGRSAMAAFTRGRILLNLGRASSAGASFEDALRLGAGGSLRENALARAVEAYGKSGNGRAQALAERYLRQYPEGRWVASVKQHGGLR
jgi:transmembrane sensor